MGDVRRDFPARGDLHQHHSCCWGSITRHALPPVHFRPRLAVSADGLYTYPDSIIVCGPPELLNFDTIMNPVVIFEVLSPSTAACDRGEKFRHYRAIPALREYVLVSQDAYLVERYERQADGRWLLSESSGLDSVVTLTSVSCTLTLRDIYEGVTATASSEGS